MTLVDHETGRSSSHHIASVGADTVREVLFTKANRKSTLVSDEEQGCNAATGEHYEEATKPCSMPPASTSTGVGFSTNIQRELLLLLKRGIYGVYHHVSPAHLGRYVTEFNFRSKSLGETMAIAAPELAFGFTYKHDDKTFATCTSFPATSCDLTTAANGVGSTTLVTAKKLLSVAMVTSAKRIAGTASTSCGYQPPQRYTSSAPRTRIRARLGRLLRFRLCCLGRMRLALSARLAQLHLGLRLRGHAHQTAQ